MAHPRRPNVTCPTCGVSFWPKRAGTRFCGRACVPADLLRTATRAWETRKPLPQRTDCAAHPDAPRYLRPGRLTAECMECRRLRDLHKRRADRMFALMYGGAA